MAGREADAGARGERSFRSALDVGAPEHPSAPIPVQGPPVGSGVRERLGESGIEIFPFILGGAEFGWHTDLPASHAVIDRYVELGGNALHTSDSFASGRSEHIIGAWLESRRLRDHMTVMVRVGSHPDHPGLGPVALVRAVEASLQRLGIERIDVLYLDGAADPLASIDETLATAEWLVSSGKVRTIGAAGFSPERLVEARILAAAGYPRITVVDTHFNLLHRADFEGDLRLVTGAQGIAVTPSHALEHGFLSGRHRSRARAGLTARGQQMAAYLNRRGQRALRAIDAVAEETGVCAAAVAVGWLLAQRGVVAPIANAYAPGHVDELVQGVGLHLTRTQVAELSRASQ